MSLIDFFVDRRRRAFERKLRITRLERADGFTISYPEADLPTIKIVRNPNGFDWDPWIALGFGDVEGTLASGYYGVGATSGSTAKSCARKARERLYENYLAKLESGQEVTV